MKDKEKNPSSKRQLSAIDPCHLPANLPDSDPSMTPGGDRPGAVPFPERLVKMLKVQFRYRRSDGLAETSGPKNLLFPSPLSKAGEVWISDLVDGEVQRTRLRGEDRGAEIPSLAATGAACPCFGPLPRRALSQVSLLLPAWTELEIAKTNIRISWIVFLRITHLPMSLSPIEQN